METVCLLKASWEEAAEPIEREGRDRERKWAEHPEL